MSVYHDDRLQSRLQKLFVLLQAKRIHESDFSKVTRLQAMSSYSFYSLMSVNMNGKTKPDERRALLSKIITSRRSSLVFCQELPDCFEKDVVRKCGTCIYDFVRTGKEAAVMWSEALFYGEPVDVAFKTRILDTVVASKNFFSHLSEITARTAVVKLTSISEACSFLAVSWHGPSKMRLEKKREVLKALILFLSKICLKKNVSSVIIGGDFNLSTSDENGLEELKVYFPWYELSPRGKLAKKRKGQGRPYIAHKDNFAITTISPSVGRPFVDMKLSKVKPLSEFNYVKEEGSERGKDILDHDPIIGVLHHGKTPSTGKFWLS